MKNSTKIDDSQRKVLIIGANGFLGRNILSLRKVEKYSEFFFMGADIINNNLEKNIPFYHIDITNSNDTYKKITGIYPELIILTAAITDVDQCEIDKDLATKLNTIGPKNVLKTCKKTASKLLFMSTDFIFDGTKNDGYYTEEDIPNPLSHYGKTKFDAESAIINSGIDYLICRTAVLYGWDSYKQNFITWILDKLYKNESLSIITSQINNPTLVNNLAEILLNLLMKNEIGLFHTAGREPLNRYEIALKCAEIFEMDKNLISSIEFLNQRAIRPKNAGLNINKLINTIGSELKIYNLEEGLKYMKSIMKINQK